jgi:4-amino-4-deoxy-L-arabinose transferase-like glycosyltransferase
VEKLPECHWYRFTPGQLFRGYFLTLALPVAPLVITALAVIIPAHFSLYGAVRLLNFCIAIAATLFIGCRSCMTTRNNDTDPAIATAIFAVIAVGNFIPWAGVFFSAAAAAVMVLLDWEILTGKK